MPLRITIEKNADYCTKSWCAVFEVESISRMKDVGEMITMKIRRSRHSQECRQTRTICELQPFDPINIRFPGLVVQHLRVKFDDPSLVFEILCQ